MRSPSPIVASSASHPSGLVLPRRKFLTAAAVPLAAWSVPGAWADMLTATPRQTEGPFYPDSLPLDTDNDLLRLNDASSPADGEVAHFSGRVLSESGEPVRNALVEIWQCDASGVYIHSRGGPREKQDANFQGFGRFLTGSDGRYYFRTIKPVAYGGRTPHIHVIVKQNGREVLTTQCYIKGEKRNRRDGIFKRTPQELRGLLTTAFEPLGDAAGQYAADWDIVLGQTPSDA